MRSTIQKVGNIVLIIGILMLIAGIICTITIGTIAVPILLTSSIVVNSIGITLRGHRKD